jgi:hypothetical protein
MFKLSQMISHMFLMIDGWNVPHHVLNDYYSKHLIHNDFRAINHFCIYDWNNNHELNHIFEKNSNVKIFFQTFCKVYFWLIFFAYPYKTLWKKNVMEKMKNILAF